jgi:hypothetical protein
MPLKHGGQAAVSYNIDELTHHGSKPRSHEQIVAIALHAARDGGSGKHGLHHEPHKTHSTSGLYKHPED